MGRVVGGRGGEQRVDEGELRVDENELGVEGVISWGGG